MTGGRRKTRSGKTRRSGGMPFKRGQAAYHILDNSHLGFLGFIKRKQLQVNTVGAELVVDAPHDRPNICGIEDGPGRHARVECPQNAANSLAESGALMWRPKKHDGPDLTDNVLIMAV